MDHRSEQKLCDLMSKAIGKTLSKSNTETRIQPEQQPQQKKETVDWVQRQAMTSTAFEELALAEASM